MSELASAASCAPDCTPSIHVVLFRYCDAASQRCFTVGQATRVYMRESTTA